VWQTDTHPVAIQIRKVQTNHQPDATIFPVYYPDVYLQLNMFQAFSRPSSGARWLQWQPLVLPSYRGDSRVVFVVGPAGPTTNEFRARFRKDAPRVFSKPCTKFTLHCNHRSGHLKTEHTKSFFLLRRHLRNWPRGPAVSMRSELLVAHEKLGQLPLLTVYAVPV